MERDLSSLFSSPLAGDPYTSRAPPLPHPKVAVKTEVLLEIKEVCNEADSNTT